MGVVEDVISFIKRSGYSCEHELLQVKDYEVGDWTWTVLTVYVDASLDEALELWDRLYSEVETGDMAVEIVPRMLLHAQSGRGLINLVLYVAGFYGMGITHGGGAVFL